MTSNETGIFDLCDEETCDTGFEKDVDVEIIDGFYYQNVPIMNDKVRLFADYWMRLYSNCCLQRDHAVQLLNDNKVEEAKATLEDWPDSFGSPDLPQLLLETLNEPKRKKRSPLTIESDAVSLIHQMKENYIRGKRLHFDVPNLVPEGEVSLVEYENYIKHCDECFKTVENYVIQNAFVYGMWLSRAFEKFQEEKSMKRVSGNFDDWVDSRCRVKKTRARQLRMFYKLFSPYKKVLRCKLPFIWFVRNGKTVVDYFKSHHEAALSWTHELDCACKTCKM